MVSLLLSFGCDVNASRVHLRHPLIAAIQNGHYDIVKLLVDAGTDLNAIVGESGRGHALCEAVTASHNDILELLLERGASTGAKDAFIEACSNGNLRAVELLISYLRSSILSKSSSSVPAFMAAVRRGHKSVVKFLLSLSFNIHATSHGGLTALHVAAKHRQLKMAELLLEKGAKVNALDNNNETPLHHAARTGSKKLLTLLLKYSPRVDVLNIDGCTARDLVPSKVEWDVDALLPVHGSSLTDAGDHVLNLPYLLAQVNAAGLQFPTQKNSKQTTQSDVKSESKPSSPLSPLVQGLASLCPPQKNCLSLSTEEPTGEDVDSILWRIQHVEQIVEDFQSRQAKEFEVLQASYEEHKEQMRLLSQQADSGIFTASESLQLMRSLQVPT